MDASLFPGPETTGTACFTYAIAWGINNGVLDAATYTPIAAAAWAGMSAVALQANGLVGYCRESSPPFAQPASARNPGLTPNPPPPRAEPPNGQPNGALPTDTSDFCVGQFLLAGSEVFKLAGGVPPQHVA